MALGLAQEELAEPAGRGACVTAKQHQGDPDDTGVQTGQHSRSPLKHPTSGHMIREISSANLSALR